MTNRITLVRAVVGSTAYGLAREGSDVDRLEVFAYPTESFWHLGELPESVGQQGPDTPEDYQRHEVGKYLRLALRCNPTLLELMWLPLEHVEVLTPLGMEMRNMRKDFLSESYVRNAYGGYAKQQAERLKRRHEEGKEGFSSDTKNRTAKHARHCFRLLQQGRELLTTGYLTVRVRNPEEYWAFDDMSVEDIYARFLEADAEFNAVDSVLPETPNRQRVDNYLVGVRRTLLGWQS